MKKISAPLLFMVFNRPEKTIKVWEKIREAEPQKLYISSDAPRSTHPDDINKVKRVREIVKNVDWDCHVQYLFHEKNHGCSLAGKTAFDWVFSNEDEMIELEDDVVPTKSFFWFMQEMLEKYKNDKRICYVCAENYGIQSGEATYFFSQYGGSWGWATWKRVYDLYEYKLDSLEEMVNTNKFKKSFPSKYQYDYWRRLFFQWKYKGGNTYDLQSIYLIHKHNLVNIIPNINLVTNIGWDAEASNTIQDKNEFFIKRFSNIPSFELDKIIHPAQVSSDPNIDTKWFKYHFQKRPEFEQRLRWVLGPFYRKIFRRNS